MLFSFRPTTLRTEEEEGDFARGLLSVPELSRKIEEDSRLAGYRPTDRVD